MAELSVTRRSSGPHACAIHHLYNGDGSMRTVKSEYKPAVNIHSALEPQSVGSNVAYRNDCIMHNPVNRRTRFASTSALVLKTDDLLAIPSKIVQRNRSTKPLGNNKRILLSGNVNNMLGKVNYP
ncbi:hypothetical protein V1477_016072 [Vespula maculifrons]|uniref:Uncharacterized protein n=1 Tax=Vespula maculifrons TaxID=7453 RepID=A0ABD2BBZ8_VESMC